MLRHSYGPQVASEDGGERGLVPATD
jgi:hypothetical protein